ncbi:PREDICTED: uncharacterized protein LOC105567314 [Vollenhovia emeryi]|uniref:uncharacterized protein LOC105567314 n=1 Tax=Vollenhovia emeryi TaxID=411798 RepID=UPI0005F45F5D|nr:PREDICTED: uncharacterized protein LOC105567314 [Vollenhovia emeryi]
MFYPNLLLSRRRRNKLAPCWFAATLSEQSFKKRYHARTIKELSVEQICQEIMEMQLDGNVPMRSSLRLSAQLMGGVTKIYSYQVNHCLKEAFQIRPMCEDEDNFRAIEMPPADPVIEMPLSGPNILNVPLEKDLHVLSDMESERLNMAMTAATCMDFGYLDKDLHFMLMCDDVSLFARDLERLHINAEEDILKRTDNVTITEEIEKQQLSQEIHGPMLVDIFSDVTKRLPLTPQKRATKEPRETHVETPTKRRRLSLEGATMIEPPGPVEDVTRQADIELEPVHSSYFVVDKPRKKTTLVTDENIALSDKLLKRWRQNVNIRCKPSATIVPRLLLTSAKDLFTQPSHSRWNARLCKRFHDRIAGPFTSVTEDVAPAELGQLAEAMRVPEEPMSKLNLPTDVSTLKRTDIAIAEPIDSTTNILPIHEMDVDVRMVPEVVHDMITLEGTGIGPRPHQENSNIADTNESFEDIENLLKKQQPLQHIPASPAISRGSSQPQLRSQELYALLQVLWCDKELVRFGDLIPNETYTKSDAATAFGILLELEAQKKLVLHQASSFCTVRISKYNDSE